MNCTRPNIIKVVKYDDDEKAKVIFVPYSNANYTESYRRYLLSDGAVEVPCGNCAACRLDYSRKWANRCYLESLCHKTTYFITLTYDDEHLVFGDKGLGTLEKDALSDFMRKVRDYYGHDLNIRFFGCGEYGDETLRPHYHLILFGAPIIDLDYNMPDMSKPLLESGRYPIFRRTNSNGDYVYFSQVIFNCWKKGKIEVEDATWNTMAYVSRYIMKKQKGRSKEIYNRLGILPPYLRMSNRPGIGAKYYLEHKNEILESDYLSIKNKAGVITSHPDRYFEKLMMKDEFSIDAQKMEVNKINRINNSNSRCVEFSSSKKVGDKLSDLEEEYEKKNRAFTRDIT